MCYMGCTWAPPGEYGGVVFAVAAMWAVAHLVYYHDTSIAGVVCGAGVLVTRRSLDRETTSEHRVTVVAQDGGGLHCRSAVHIILTDVNDNAPQFVPRPQYTGSVKEDASIGTPILRVAAVDSDLGLSRQVRYFMEPPHGVVFAVDPVSGVITLLQLLDRERQASYNLRVSAVDQVRLWTSQGMLEYVELQQVSKQESKSICKACSYIIQLGCCFLLMECACC